MSGRDRDDRASTSMQRSLPTILFSDIVGYSSLVERFEPEDVLVAIARFQRRAREIIEAHGGEIASLHGDGIMAMFGHPTPSEDDGLRAVDAALALHRAVRDEPAITASRVPSISLHTGIHCEHVAFQHDAGARGQYTPVGLTAPVAQRLSAHGNADEILVSASTLGGDVNFYETRDRGLVALKGIGKPLAVIQVLRRSTARSRWEARSRRGLTSFGGRAPELALLQRALDDALAGRRAEIAIVASPGVGKTRLVEEFLRGIPRDRVRVCRGYCEHVISTGTLRPFIAEPLQPFLQVLRHLASEEPRDDAPVSQDEPPAGLRADGSPGGAPEVQPSAAERFRDLAPQGVLEGEGVELWLCSLFSTLAHERPLVLFIDDCQWADSATNHVLVHLRQAAPPGLLLLTASRERAAELPGHEETCTIELGPLDHDSAERIVRELRPDADPIVTERILDLSGGNPLFLEELCHWAAPIPDDGPAVPPGRRLAWLHRRVEARVALLPAAVAEVVRAAAVIGVTVPLWLLRRIDSQAAHESILARLAEEDLLYPADDLPDCLRFKHGLTRDAIYASLGRERRMALHHRIATLLESIDADAVTDGMLEELSYHLLGAGEFEKGASYAERAGDKARRPAPDRALKHYEAALEALDALVASEIGRIDSSRESALYAQWRRLTNSLGEACVFDPSPAQVRRFTETAELARARGDHAWSAESEFWLGFIHYALGDLGRAIAHYERARDDCMLAIEAAGALGDASEVTGMRRLLARVIATIGQTHAAAGGGEAALRMLGEVLAGARAHGRARPAVGAAYTLACKGAVLGDLGRFAEAYECFDQAVEAMGDDSLAGEASVLGWRSAVELWQGEWEAALASATRAYRLAERVSRLYILGMTEAMAAYARWQLQHTAESLDAIARATSWLEARGQRLTISIVYGFMADINADLHAAGRPTEAATRRWAARAILRAQRHDPFGEVMSCCALARLPWRGRGPTPEAYLRRAAGSPPPSVPESPPREHGASTLGRPPRQRSPRETAIARWQAGMHAQRTGRRDEALALLEQARGELDSLQMAWFARQARALIQELNGPTAPNDPLHLDANRKGPLTRA